MVDYRERLIDELKVERKVWQNKATKEDIDYVKSMINEHHPSPFALYVVGIAYLFGSGVKKDIDIALDYLDQCYSLANGELLMELANAYYKAGENFYSRMIDCVKKAAWKKVPAALEICNTLLNK